MDFASIIAENLLSPMVLFFVLGVLAGLFKSDLEIPEQMATFLSIYLISAIGFKGGVSFASVDINPVVISTILAGVGCGVVIPLIGYIILQRISKLHVADCAAVAAHYGSISVMTFLTAASFLKSEGIDYQGFIVGIVALMEIPAIIVALLLARRYTNRHKVALAESLRELAANGSVLLLVGSMGIGYTVGPAGMAKLQGFFVEPFYGMLSLFLLEMGLRASKESEHIRNIERSLIVFAVVMPIICGTCGSLIARMIGLDIGTGLLFSVLIASSSYIAVPAALKIALPEANPSIYLPLSLGITFPFNVVFGIPIYYFIAEQLWR